MFNIKKSLALSILFLISVVLLQADYTRTRMHTWFDSQSSYSPGIQYQGTTCKDIGRKQQGCWRVFANMEWFQ
jgi:hypothetical protein